MTPPATPVPPLHRTGLAVLVLLALTGAGCEPLPPPPAGTGSPATAAPDSADPPPPPTVAEPVPGLAVPGPPVRRPSSPSHPLFPARWRFPEVSAPPARSGGAVASSDSRATGVGLEILARGGNAVDATVATALALAVVDPEAGNLGGGGFVVLRRGDGASIALDFRETAPERSSPDMFLDEAGGLTERSMVGHLASGVPGTVRGLWDMHQRFGVLSWEQVVEPAIALAEGAEVSERLARSLATHRRALELFEGTRSVLLPGGEVPAVGSIILQPELAATLRRIRDEGPDGFYRGETAELIVAEMERGGGDHRPRRPGGLPGGVALPGGVHLSGTHHPLHAPLLLGRSHPGGHAEHPGGV